MQIVSWNINALRAHENSFRRVMTVLQPDVFCLQEIRVREDQQTFPVKGYHSMMNPAAMSQYYGTGIFMRNDIRPLSVSFDRPLEGYIYQGRVIAVELEHFFIVNSYWPFSSSSKWLAYRVKWTEQFQSFIHQLQKSKPVIICGDMNIVKENADAFDGQSVKKAGCFYYEEHENFERLLKEECLIDSFRALHPLENSQMMGSGEYSAWPYSTNDIYRHENKGFRIDYFLVSEKLMPKVVASDLQPNFWGSDHCPISLEINI